jgi:hypothetical protein
MFCVVAEMDVRCGSEPVVSLKSESDILMAFVVSAIASTECVGSDSNELARTRLQLCPGSI